MKRRVLLIDLGAKFGGVETYLVSLAGLLACDIDLYVLCVLPELSTRLADLRGQGYSPASVSRYIQTAPLSGRTDRCATAPPALSNPYCPTQWLS